MQFFSLFEVQPDIDFVFLCFFSLRHTNTAAETKFVLKVLLFRNVCYTGEDFKTCLNRLNEKNKQEFNEPLRSQAASGSSKCRRKHKAVSLEDLCCVAFRATMMLTADRFL